MGSELSNIHQNEKKVPNLHEFSIVKSFKDKNIGSIEMFKHKSKSEYMIRKKVRFDDYANPEDLLTIFLKRLDTESHQNLQKIVEIND